MLRQRCAREDSDDDIDKCSDDAVNVAKSKQNKSGMRLVLKSIVKFVSTVITIVVSVTIINVICIGDPIINVQSREDILMLSDQLKRVSTKMDDYCSSFEESKGVYLCKELEEQIRELEDQNRKLKTKHQMAEAEKDTSECGEADCKGNEPPRFVCLSASSKNNLYTCVFGNRCLASRLTDTLNIITKFKLAYPEIADDDKILLEFGFMTSMSLRSDIIVRALRCMEEPGICFYILDDVWTKLENVAYQEISEYVQVDITLELHQSNFVLLSNSKNIYISKTSNDLSMDELFPVFGFYNTHLIHISQTIYSKYDIRFDGTTVDPHLFISEDFTTLSTSQLLVKRQHPYFWGSPVFCIPVAVLTACTCIYYCSRMPNN